MIGEDSEMLLSCSGHRNADDDDNDNDESIRVGPKLILSKWTRLHDGRQQTRERQLMNYKPR